MGRSRLRAAQVAVQAFPAEIALVDDGFIKGPQWPLIADGEYLAKVVGHETATVFKTPKIFLHFQIVRPGQEEVLLYAAYRAKDLIGHPGKNGRFILGRRSELLLQLCRLDGKPMRGDRISLRGLRRCLLRVRTRTVVSDYRQRPLPEAMHYSVVAEMLAIEVGSFQE